MRLTHLLALGVAFLAGCASTSEVYQLPPAVETALATPPESNFATAPFADSSIADSQKTLGYWKKLKEIVERKSSDDLKTAMAECKHSVNEIRKIPAVGVDGELLATSEHAARTLERLLIVGDFAMELTKSEARRLGLDRSILNLWEQSNQSVSQLKGLRAKLSNRYGIEFPSMESPN
jgi:hypothetical protein